jgi:hypothetical protein
MGDVSKASASYVPTNQATRALNEPAVDWRPATSSAPDRGGPHDDLMCQATPKVLELLGEPQNRALELQKARPDVTISTVFSDLTNRLPPFLRGLIGKAPDVGQIGNEVGMGVPAVISSPEFGESSAAPSILKLRVGPTQVGPLVVGQKAYEKFWQGYPAFDFNVSFSCAKANGLDKISTYADPRSPWFNVFFGRYQIDAPTGQGQWQRPFGFVNGTAMAINFDDILRVGNSDWGYFSNWMYGVPEAELDKVFAAQDAAPPPKTRIVDSNVIVNGKRYVEAEVDGVMLPSAYVSGEDGKALTDNVPVASFAWREIFGKQGPDVANDPTVAAEYPQSFAPTQMKMRFFLRYEKVNGAYHTFIYGGGVNQTWAGDDPDRQAFNERFLDAQMDAVKNTMP